MDLKLPLHPTNFSMEEQNIDENYNSQYLNTTNHVSHEISTLHDSIKKPSGALYEHELDYLVSSIFFFITRAIGFQINTFINFFMFPIFMMYYSLMFLVDPFRMLKWARNCTIRMLLSMWGCVFGHFAPMLNGHKTLAKLVMRICGGLFWSIYVCFLLFGLLIMGFVIGGVTMKYVVEEPIQKMEFLNFDYSKSSPVALVPIMACPTVSCGVNCREKIEVEKYDGVRVIPPDHKVQLGITLTLPESEYNQKLGIFQVRVEYISANGEVTATSTYPCMLQYKSHFIRLVETFVKSIPILAGYSSESQTLDLKMRGFTEGDDPTSCIKVIIEQRAEYSPGAGIPELYAASLVLNSELSLIKRAVWYWKRTIFIWISMASFMMELMFVLVCCRSIVMPRAREMHVSAKKAALESDVARIKGN